MSWFEARLGPSRVSGLEDLALARTLVRTARRTTNVIAASAGPDRARLRPRSRSASRTATGARRLATAGTPTTTGASRSAPRTVATTPPTPVHPPAEARQPSPTASRTIPGAAERRDARGEAGRPERAVTTGTRAAARAGRQEA